MIEIHLGFFILGKKKEGSLIKSMSQTKGIEMNQDKKYITKPIVEVVLNTLQVRQLFYGESITHN